MVKSRINPENINYKEDRTIDEEDIGTEASIYEYEYNKINIIIALGKEKYTYSKYNVIYFPIYLIVDNSPRAKIGAFEVDSNNFISILDEDGDIMLEKGNVLFYSFVNDDYIKKLSKKSTTDPANLVTEIEKRPDQSTTEEITEGKEEEKEDAVDEDDVTRLKLPKQSLSKEKEKTDKILKDGIFAVDPTQKVPVMLPEENEEISNTIKSQFMENKRNNWVENFMKNNNYNIVDNEGGGDCFFATIRDAYDQIGQKTTVEKLRAVLAKEATDDVYLQYRTLYLNFLAELQSKEKEMKEIKKISAELKKRNDRTKDKEEIKKITAEAKSMISRFNKLKEEKEDVKELMEEFKDMGSLDTFEKFKEYIQTPNFWADTWATSTIEKILNIKVIILSNEAYDAGDLDSVLQCGQLNDNDLEKQGNFSPTFYIVVSYTGNHYTLITYKNKRIFKFLELPHDIKSLVINKCMERNAGPYYLIQDFRNLKSRLGLSPDEGSPSADEDEEMQHDLYDPETVFMFYSKSSAAPRAGKAPGEKITDARITEFNTLNKDKTCNDWRKKLDDSWIAPFTIQGHRWSSVEHYWLGSQYKKGFPDFMLQFSLDSETDISKDVSLARSAAGKSGKLKDRTLRPKNVKTDADFFEVGPNQRSIQEREYALEAKFSQNMDLKKILMETKNAKLVHFVRSEPPIVDEQLMKLRARFAVEKEMDK
jgi:hypothetical protein